MRAVALVLLALASCDGPPASLDAGRDGSSDAGPRACRTHTSCGEGQRCAVGSIAEIAVEPGERGACTPVEALLGFEPRPLVVRPGGGALADRLCLAQGISPGAGNDALRARQVELLRASGARLVRLDFRWASIEREAGRFDFSAHDPVVDAADAAGVEVLALLGYGVPWATSAEATDEFFPPDDPADFARYATEVARRYAGRIDRFEIWNEPNGGYRFWKPTAHGDAAAFGALQAAAASAVRAECEGCTIYSAGLFFHEQLINGALEFTNDMLEAAPGALRDADAFGLHPYPLYPPDSPPEGEGASRSFAAIDADVRELLARHGASLPIAATELGWPVYGRVDEDAQARLLSRAMLLGAALGWDPICWFNVTDGPLHGSFPPEDDFGLYRFGSEDPASPIDPKPARDALAWLARIGEDAVVAGAREDPALHDPARGRFALDFDAPGGRWTVLWSLEPHTVRVEEPHAVHDHLGAERGTTPADLEIGEGPVFLLPP